MVVDLSGISRLDVALDHALAQMDRARRVTVGPFVVFARVDQDVTIGGIFWYCSMSTCFTRALASFTSFRNPGLCCLCCVLILVYQT